MATLKRFLETGELGPIRHGLTEAEVVAQLGKPDDESVARNPKILKYGSLQLAFSKRIDNSRPELTNIGLYFGPGSAKIPEPVRPTDFEGTAKTTVAEFTEFVEQNELDVQSRVEDEESSYLLVRSGARITFDGPELHSIHFAARIKGAPTQQFSISMSDKKTD